MKNLILSAGLCAALLFTSGCASLTSNQTRDSVRVISVVVPPSVAYCVLKNPQTVPYFIASAGAINVFAGGTNYSPAALMTSLNQIPQFGKTPESSIAIMGAVGLYSAFFSDYVGNNTNLVTVLEALSSNILLGVGEPKAQLKHRYPNQK